LSCAASLFLIAMKCIEYFGRRIFSNNAVTRSTILIIYSLPSLAFLRFSVSTQSLLSFYTYVVFSVLLSRVCYHSYDY